MATTGTLDAQVLREWAARAVQALDAHRHELDALNVFPVADSDTGTNLWLTLREGLHTLDLVHEEGRRPVARGFARGALIGARGNSGVIVSQYLGALLGELTSGPLSAATLRDALQVATTAAYRAVAHPVEGTVLTVARAVADGTGTSTDLGEALEDAIDAGYVALARTTAQLAPLRAAGVLDAGAWGLLLVLEAFADALAGPAGRPSRPRPAVHEPDAGHENGGHEHEHGHGHEHGHDPAGRPCPEVHAGGPGVDAAPDTGEFEVMYLVEGAPVDVTGADVADTLRGALAAVGDSAAVVGAEGLWQAHVHTDVPLDALEVARTAGLRATQVRVRHLASQSGVHGLRRPRLGMVAVTGAPALAPDLARAGAVVVLVGPGAVAGPELGRAVEDTGATTVLVLGAAGLLDVEARPGLRVEAGLSEVQVVAGAATFASLDPDLDDDRLADDVVAAVRAVRCATIHGRTPHRGAVDAAGDAAGDAVGAGGHADRVVAAARALVAEPATLLTVLVGAGTPEEVGARVTDELRATGVEVLVLPTGAPGDTVVLGAE